MRRRFDVPTDGKAIRIQEGWKPTGFMVLNPSDKPVYVKEGGIDASIGPTNYDWLVPKYSWLSIPTDVDIFSVVLGAGATLKAQVLVWDNRETVAPNSGPYGGA